MNPAGAGDNVINASKTRSFYTVQNSDEAARLMGDGLPWPTKDSFSALGEGLYTWDNLEDAEKYMSLLKRYKHLENETFSILKVDVDEQILRSFKSLKVDDLADPDEFMKRYSKLWDGTPDHGYDYIIRDVNLGSEHFFDKSVFKHLRITND